MEYIISSLRGVIRHRRYTLRADASAHSQLLERAKVRDPRALAFGTYRLVDADTGELYAGDPPTGYGLDLDQIEAVLDRGRRPSGQ